MFRFASPIFLLLLAVVPLILYLRWKRGDSRPAMSLSRILHVKRIQGSFFIHTLALVYSLKYLAFILMVLALARPQWGTQKKNIETEGVNIVLAVDVSGSMSALDFKRDGRIVDRLEAIKGVVRDFITRRENDRIGLVVFGTHAFTQVPLTRDYNTLSFVLEKLQIGSAGESTAVGDAIGIALKRLEDIKSKSNVIILLTDGESNAGELSPEIAAGIAFNKRVKIYTIGVGSRGRAPYRVQDPLFGERFIYQDVTIDEETLERVAKKTGGLYFRAENTQGLEDIYATIDRLEKTKVDVTLYFEYREFYPYLLGPAIGLLLLGIVLENTRYLRIP